MSVIASALKHMLAAGMPHDAIIAAVEEMEAQIALERDGERVEVEKPRTANAIRQARHREKLKAQEAAGGVTESVTRNAKTVTNNAQSVTVTPDPLQSVTSNVTAVTGDAKGSRPPIPKETSPLHPPKEITLTLPLSQSVFDQNIENLDGKDTQPRAREGANARKGATWPADAFEQFWRLYPHKVGKDAAIKAFDKIRRNPSIPIDQFLEALRRYIRTKPPDRSWCNPSTWMNQGRWADEPDYVAKIQPSGASRNDKPSGLNAALDRLEDYIDGRSGPVDREFRQPSEREDFGF